MLNVSMAEPDNLLRPCITVVGVGGAGSNAVNNMVRSGLEGCTFVAANTDAQALAQSLAPQKLQLGVNLSRGLGAGSKPDVGRAAAEEQIQDILNLLEGSDMLFVTAGMGGGTGTGAAPVIARAARECGILTVGVVTKPFQFEGAHRMRQAEAGINELQKYVDTLIVIPNQNLFRIANERTTFADAFRLADEVLHSGVRGITDLMVMPGFMNLDFADVKTVMGEMGKAMMGTGEAEGEERAIRAAEAAISNPLLDDISMKGARGVLINITGGLDMTLFEVDQAARRIRDEVDPEAQIKVGSTLGDDMDGLIRVSIIATGIDAALAEQQRQRSGSGASSTPISISTTAPQQSQPVSGLNRVPSEAARRPSTSSRTVSVAATTASSDATTSSASAASYFAMPQSITPQQVTRTTSVPPSDRPATPASAAVQADEVETPAPSASNAASASSPVASARQHAAKIAQSPAAPPPVRRATVAATQPVHDDPRMTQITTTSTQSAPSSQVSQRSQSLFQRITGFGLVRPSVRDSDDLDVSTQDASNGKGLDVDPADRPVLSSEPAEQLEIPAFLRRQTNH